MTTNHLPREIIFEFNRVGAYVKVSAMDVESQLEVSITGAANAPQDYLEQLARQKLYQQLQKEGIVK